MSLMDLLMTTYAPRTYTIADFKKEMMTNSRSLKFDIDSCPDRSVVRRTLELPSRCDRNHVDLCFVGHEGQYAMMIDRPVRYYGTNPDLYRLFRDGMIIFDNWYELTRFWDWLPYVE